jgi:hypothetical protein
MGFLDKYKHSKHNRRRSMRNILARNPLESSAMNFQQLEMYTTDILNHGFKEILVLDSDFLVNEAGYDEKDINTIFGFLRDLNSLLAEKYNLVYKNDDDKDFSYGISMQLTKGNFEYTFCPEWKTYPTTYKIYVYRENRYLNREDLISLFPELVFVIDDLG